MAVVYAKRVSGHSYLWVRYSPVNGAEYVRRARRYARKANLVPLVVAAKLALYTAMREQQLSKVGLAARMGLSEGAIRKLLNPEHRSHIRQVEKALRKVDKRLVVEVSRR